MNRLFTFARRVMPKISSTEKIALKSGTSSIEKLAFYGSLDHGSIPLRYKSFELTNNDKTMLEKAPQLISTVDEYEIIKARQTPIEHPFWNKAKREGFFGLIVPDEYGGTKLSSTGLSKLLQSLSSCSASVPVHVMVPASLGPAELLTHYGTQEQKEYFLPKLAKGAIPCFALTSADAGSDAAGSMVDTGTVYKRKDGSIGILVNCEKRYITLSPVADIVGIAFKLVDEHNLLEQKYGKSVNGEITLALVEKGRENLHIGAYTDPLGVGFANGTVVAKNMDIDVKDVIGAENGLGEGWKYLMEALAAGRGIALPAGACGSSKMLTNAVSGYAEVRKQFKVPLSKFEGIKEKLADMALKTFEIDSLVALMNSALDNGERPPILSAILKQRSTELGRDVVMHSMDIMAGSAICMGPQNFVAPAYLSNPIGITVEGSNTMTRSLLIFGQGVVRSHPYMLELIDAIETNDKQKFNKNVWNMISDNFKTMFSLFPKTDQERFVQFFSLSTNASLLLGGKLKFMEYLSGRYADTLSYIIAGFAMEWHCKNNNIPWKIDYALQYNNLHRLQQVTNELVDNHPHKYLHRFLYMMTIGNRHKHGIMKDEYRNDIVQDLVDPDGSLRHVFNQDVLKLHPNVVRIEKALNAIKYGTNEELDALRKEIIKVDVFGEDL